MIQDRRLCYCDSDLVPPHPMHAPGAFIELVEIPKGGCKICGCPPDQMPMIFRGTGWCSDNHRKELQGD